MELKTFMKNLYKAYTMNNVYVNGGFGVTLKGNQIDRHINLNSYNREHEKQIRKAAENFPCFGFDCIGLIKGIVWGWCGDSEKVYGGATYELGDIEDIALSNFFTRYGGDIKYITNTDYPLYVGSLLWSSGHIAVYIGEGVAIESTRYSDRIRFVRVKGMKSDFHELPEREFTAYANFLLLDANVVWDREMVTNFMLNGNTEKPTPKPTVKYRYLKVIDSEGEVVCVEPNTLQDMIDNVTLKFPIMITEDFTDEADWGK